MSVELLRNFINDSKHIVFFGGAGVSTESGIPDFRSVDGLYNQHYDYPPETILSHHFFMKNPSIFFQFYREKIIHRTAKPNITHNVLTKLEQNGKTLSIITQNIDGLHQLAGSQHVYELHGSIHRNHCMECQQFYNLNDIITMPLIPRCHCGGIIKPDVILYEESLPDHTVTQAIHALQTADLLIVAGTSLRVYPAASFVDYFNGEHTVIINKEQTSYDHRAQLCFHSSLGEIFQQIL
ncbi:NAD-dependent protein deacylase [Entomospira nematocerorum]|uniref:protein acetyllysine N-acetyltransferase n=1 Tax=Entomospira nematocerorum TaxID=2719987 RepID=A0A968KTU4_9SPIO|nr:NAD-dependent protein deacylase [Entomospira nematocera]NIZ46564.1 NAD-dependent protein deacylase [Entomospira nematocera]WDI33638.1 NAD-dependent protein deacylase [Entomospira nematocera]